MLCIWNKSRDKYVQVQVLGLNRVDFRLVFDHCCTIFTLAVRYCSVCSSY